MGEKNELGEEQNEEGDEHHEEGEENELVEINAGVLSSAYFDTIQGALETIMARLERLSTCVGDMTTRMQGIKQRQEFMIGH